MFRKRRKEPVRGKALEVLRRKYGYRTLVSRANVVRRAVEVKAPKKPAAPKKRGRGRPRLPASQKATLVSIYLTPPERAALRAFVKADKERTGAHVTASDVVRGWLRRKRSKE